MSVTPSCARIEPSTISTIECTTDCGCTTTSIRPAGTPNSHRASITSSPLFINVAESIVIFLPMRQVGCFSASVGPTAASSVREWPRKGPPDAVRISRLISCAGRPCTHWWMALCSLSTGQNLDAVTARGVGHQRARHDEHFLVRERDRLAGLDRRQHRLERGGPGRRAQHHVHVGAGRERDEPVGAVAGDLDAAPDAQPSQEIRQTGRTPSRSPAAGAPPPAPRTAPRCRPRPWRRSRDGRGAPRPPTGRCGRSTRSLREWQGVSRAAPIPRTSAARRTPAPQTASRRSGRARRRAPESGPSCPSRRRFA